MIDAKLAVLTAPQRGAVATVAVLGHDAQHVVQRFFIPSQAAKPLSPNSVRYGSWQSNPTVPAEGVVLSVLSAERLEIHCHGGRAAVQQIVTALESAGCQKLTAHEYLVSIGYSSLEADCLEVLSRTQTTWTAALALAQVQGALRSELTEIRRQIEFHDLPQARQRLETLVLSASYGLHLATPWIVALAGPPNVGKSSLLNVLAGWQRAITSPSPGTTRDTVRVEIAVNGWPLCLEDTAGVRESSESIEQEGIERTKQAVRRADLVIMVVDGQVGVTQTHQQLAVEATEVLWVWNKVDVAPLPEQAKTLPFLETSSKSSSGIPELLKAIESKLIPVPPASQQAILLTLSQRDAVVAAMQAVERGDAVAAFEILEPLVSGPQLPYTKELVD